MLLANTFNAQSLGFGTILGFGILGMIVFAVILVAVIVLKGYALWYAARRGEKVWFIVLLVLNTMGILELVYLAFVVKKWSKPSTPIDGSTPGAPHHA